MEEVLKFEELYNAYLLCLKNKKRKAGTFNFVNSNLCENLISLLNSLNNRTYKLQASNCYVITNPALNCKYKCNENVRNKVPERRKMNLKSEL